MTNYCSIGKLVATFGFNGELVLKHHLGKKTSLKGLQTIFIEEKKESFLPWFIESTKIKNEKEVFVKLEGVASREAATKLTQKEVWFTDADIKKFSAKSSPINLLGYTIVNNKQPVGEILEIIEQPHQLLCRVEIKGKEALIPLHENFLQGINHAKRHVNVELPEGLIEIYL